MGPIHSEYGVCVMSRRPGKMGGRGHGGHTESGVGLGLERSVDFVEARHDGAGAEGTSTASFGVVSNSSRSRKASVIATNLNSSELYKGGGGV